eukprot:jgi/Mesen1/10992/ME000097S10568
MMEHQYPNSNIRMCWHISLADKFGAIIEDQRRMHVKSLLPKVAVAKSLLRRRKIRSMKGEALLGYFEDLLMGSQRFSICLGLEAQPRSQAEGAGAVTSDALRADYEQRAYFITGNITEALYSEDCFFGDPTVSFTGLQRWRRNIRLLVPFFEEPSVALHSIVAQDEEGGGRAFVTQWRLRTYLKFPWRPLIDIDGSTKHSLDETNTKASAVVRHVESWGVSAIEALGQMFVASDRALWSRSRARSPSGSPKK